jgi:uncharacterized protein (TIGR00251 family)
LISIRLSSFGFRHSIMTLAVKVTPNARRSEIVGWGTDEQGRRVLQVRLAAPAHEGKANKELIRFLADVLDCPKNSLSLQRGELSRTKVLEIPSEAAARLE